MKHIILTNNKHLFNSLDILNHNESININLKNINLHYLNKIINRINKNGNNISYKVQNDKIIIKKHNSNTFFKCYLK